MQPVKEIIDLGRELYNGMPNVGGLQIAFWPVETFDQLETVSEGKYGQESRMMLLAEHCSTHIDAPRHFDRTGVSVGQVPLERLIMPGHLYDFTWKKRGEAITIDDFKEAERKTGKAIGPDAAVICWTGVDKHWGVGDWMRNRPHVPTDTASWLADRGMILFVTDMMGMDDPREWWWPTHKIWLTRNICMVQQCCNFERLVGKEFLFVASPLNMRDGTGCPVRPIALVV